MRVGVEADAAVEQVLKDVEAGIAEVGLGVDDQPRLPLGSQHVAVMEISAQKHIPRAALAGSCPTVPSLPGPVRDRAGCGGECPRPSDRGRDQAKSAEAGSDTVPPLGWRGRG